MSKSFEAACAAVNTSIPTDAGEQLFEAACAAVNHTAA